MLIEHAPDIARALKRASLLMLALIAVAVIVCQMVMHYTLRAQRPDAALLRLAAGQATLSQRVAKAALMVDLSTAELNRADHGRDNATSGEGYPASVARAFSADKVRQSAQAELRTALSAWTATHALLMQGDEDLYLPEVHPPQISALLERLDEPFRQALLGARSLLSGQRGTAHDPLQVLMQGEAQYLRISEQLISAFETQSQAHSRHAYKTKFALMVLMLLLLPVLAWYILRPAIRRTRQMKPDASPHHPRTNDHRVNFCKCLGHRLILLAGVKVCGFP